MKHAALAAWMVTAMMVGVSYGEEVPALTSFRVEPVGLIGVSYQGQRGVWSVVSIGGGPRTVFIDGAGQMLECRIVSWDHTAPIEQEIRGGDLVVRQRGRTYRFCPQGVQQRQFLPVYVARPHDGIIFRWWCTAPELVETTSFVPVTQWVEVIQSPVPARPASTSALNTT